MTLTLNTTAEEIRAAKVDFNKKTGHFSYTGRAELIKELADIMIKEGKLDPAKNDYASMSGKARRATGAFDYVVPIVKARFPHHASEVHVMTAFWSYVTSIRRKLLKAQAETPVTPKRTSKRSGKGAKCSEAKDQVSVAA